MDYQGVNVLKGFADTFSNFETMFLHPYSHRFTLGEAFYNVVVTLGLAFLTTFVTYLLSWTFLRFEMNFANAVAMGAAAGAGGIGFDLFMAGGFYFDLREVGLITYLIIAIAIVLEVISTNIKGKLQKNT